jgi:hypothetical protein
MAISVDHIEPRPSRPTELDKAINHTVEKLTSGVVSVSWADPEVRRVDRPYRHYRIGIGNKPPVDLSFDEFTGRLAEVQLVLQDESVPVREVFAEKIPVESGSPVVDVSPWGDSNYLDYRFDPNIGWQPLGTLSVEVAPSAISPIREYDLGKLGVLVGGDSKIVGLRFIGLTSDQLLTIRQAESGVG